MAAIAFLTSLPLALAEAALTTGEKRGRWTWWRIVPERCAALRLALDPG